MQKERKMGFLRLLFRGVKNRYRRLVAKPHQPLYLGGGFDEDYEKENTMAENAIPIQLNTNNLAKLAAGGPAALQAAVDSSPIKLDKMFGVKTGASADMALMAASSAIAQPRATGTVTKSKSIYAKGELVWDTEKSAKVTITRTSVGLTSKGRPIHKVVDRYGDSWLQTEAKLKPNR